MRTNSLLAGTMLAATLLAAPAFAQTARTAETQEANAPDQKPAFENQTRAPLPDAVPEIGVDVVDGHLEAGGAQALGDAASRPQRDLALVGEAAREDGDVPARGDGVVRTKKVKVLVRALRVGLGCGGSLARGRRGTRGRVHC